MSANTKIVVLKMKNLVITLLFAGLGIIMLILLAMMFKDKTPANKQTSAYIPGVYKSCISLNNQAFDVEVIVDQNNITAVKFSNLSESVTTMFPLMQGAMSDLSSQILEKQSTQDLVIKEDMKYTSQLLLNAVNDALSKASSTY